MNKRELFPVLQAALDYAANSWPVFPCRLNKSPFTLRGFKDATRDPNQIRAWWRWQPNAMVGVATGTASGTFVVDLDRKPGKSDGIATWDDLIVKHSTPPTLSARTPSTGRHLFFRHRELG